MYLYALKVSTALSSVRSPKCLCLLWYLFTINSVERETLLPPSSLPPPPQLQLHFIYKSSRKLNSLVISANHDHDHHFHLVLLFITNLMDFCKPFCTFSILFFAVEIVA